MTHTQIIRMLVRSFLAEAFGTLFLAAGITVAVTATANGSSGYETLYMPFAAGLTLTVLVASLGRISGAHLNPAITVAHALFRKIELRTAGVYVVAQLLGAWAGVQIAGMLLAASPILPRLVNVQTVTAEFVGAVLLVFTVSMAAFKRIDATVAPLAIGGALAAAVSMAYVTGGGVLNPAIALALGSHAVTYLVVPLLGGLTGTALAIIFDESEPAPSDAH